MFVQSVDGARAAQVGDNGLDTEALDAILARADRALANLRGQQGTLRLLDLPTLTDDLADTQAAADKLRAGATDIVFLGTGGSSLGGQTLVQLAGYNVPGVWAFHEGPRLHFMDNLDPLSFEALLARAPLETTRFVAVSKSGGTGETLMQTAAVLGALRAAGLESRIGELVLGLSEPAPEGKRNGLRALLEPYGVAFLPHDTRVGGRFSVLTNVGLLPAAVAGLDIAAIRDGALASLAPVLAGKPAREVPAALGAAFSVAMAERGKPITVMMAYADRLERLTKWWVQLWAESLGKDGKGSTPVAAIGPVDQHSQLQLFIAGPRDKFFTVITVDGADLGPRIEADLAGRAGEADFGGRTIGDLVAAQGRATADTLIRNGCPVRTIKLTRLDERALGQLLMHFMLETIIAADLLGVDAYDQPAVEEGKILAKKYLVGRT